jgi:hypothetical protein
VSCRPAACSASAPPGRRQPDILARLEQAVGEIQDSESFRAYLAVQARFHRYSPGNVALIMVQCPDATQVAGYQAWLRLHRYVKRGEKAIKIIVPMTRKVETADGEEERKLIFGTGNVFDVSQTDGEPLPDIAVPTLEGAEGVGLLLQLYELAQAEGLDVRNVPGEQMPSETMMGYYDRAQRVIAVREAAPRQMAKTLAHELGHHFAEHPHSDAEAETTAESIAYVVCGHFGLDTGERSFPYIATWAKDKKVLQQALGTIQKVSATIIDALEGPGRPAEGEGPADALEQGPTPSPAPEL